MRLAVFKGFDFAQNGLIIADRDGLSSRAPLTLQLEPLAVADGSVPVSSRFEGKPITLHGTLTADTLAQLETRMDTVNQMLGGSPGILDLDYAGSTRRFMAIAENVIFTEKALLAAEFDIQFVVPSCYGSDLDASTLIDATQFTTLTKAFPITVGGSYKAQPDITINLSAAAGDVPPRHITITNPDNSSYVTVSGDFQPGDNIVIDCTAQQAYLNYTTMPTAGNFPYWETGSGTLQYADDLDTRTATLSASYMKRWS